MEILGSIICRIEKSFGGRVGCGLVNAASRYFSGFECLALSFFSSYVLVFKLSLMVLKHDFTKVFFKMINLL